MRYKRVFTFHTFSGTNFPHHARLERARARRKAQDEIAMAIEEAGRMGMVGGETHNRLPALAGANVGRGQPLDVVLRGHGQALEGSPAEHRAADDERMENETEREIKQRPDHNRDGIVAGATRRDSRRASIGAMLEGDPIVPGP